MDKMWASFIAMGLMLVAVLLVTFARSKTKGAVRFILSFLAFLLLIPALLYGLISMF
ncbi:DUF2768 family protein [Paenibacillus turpanensis]|uniref:DUF2768 family protein n=1 Tax=Paenibacillus turpanensis TaxID=2689078 RepID=UPI003C7E2FE1